MIDSGKLQEALFAATSEPEQNIIQRVSLAGQKVLFDKNTHQPLFDSMMSGEGDMGDKLGSGVSNLMLLLLDQSKGSMPRGALHPAGAIILAKVAEFISKAGMGEIDDAAFNKALESMSVKLMDRFDPSFRGKVADKTGQPPIQPPTQLQPPTQPAPSGIINSGAGA